MSFKNIDVNKIQSEKQNDKMTKESLGEWLLLTFNYIWLCFFFDSIQIKNLNFVYI